MGLARPRPPRPAQRPGGRGRHRPGPRAARGAGRAQRAGEGPVRRQGRRRRAAVRRGGRRARLPGLLLRRLGQGPGRLRRPRRVDLAHRQLRLRRPAAGQRRSRAADLAGSALPGGLGPRGQGRRRLLRARHGRVQDRPAVLPPVARPAGDLLRPRGAPRAVRHRAPAGGAVGAAAGGGAAPRRRRPAGWPQRRAGGRWGRGAADGHQHAAGLAVAVPHHRGLRPVALPRRAARRRRRAPDGLATGRGGLRAVRRDRLPEPRRRRPAGRHGGRRRGAAAGRAAVGRPGLVGPRRARPGAAARAAAGLRPRVLLLRRQRRALAAAAGRRVRGAAGRGGRRRAGRRSARPARAVAPGAADARRPGRARRLGPHGAGLPAPAAVRPGHLRLPRP